MTTVAVTGAGQALAGAVLERLDADRSVERIVGLDCDEPQMPVAKLEFRTADIRDRALSATLHGVDVVVHLAMTPAPLRNADEMFSVNVSGTRNLLDACAAAGVKRFVHVSSAAVYGAYEGNPVPLDETTPLRAKPEFGWAYQHLLAEELVTEWEAADSGRSAVILRPPVVLGPGMDTAITRFLEQPVLPAIKGSEPPLQVVSSDDLADAVAFVIDRDLRGAYNVAADGWLSLREVAVVLGRPRVHLPETVAYAVAALLWSRGLVDAPPTALGYLMEPWVLSTEKLHEAGWAASRSNREVLRAFAAEHDPWLSLGSRRVRKADLLARAVGVLAGVAVATLATRHSPSRRRGGRNGQ